MNITHLKVYDLEESIIASGLPMSTSELDFSKCTEKDYIRAKKLANVDIGTGHDCFLRGIRISFNIKASQNWWLQAERYKFIDICSCTSKMHRIVELLSVNNENNYNEYVDNVMIKRMNELVDEYNKSTIKNIKDELYLKLLYSCPTGFELTARITTNYLQLKTIWGQRRFHRLPEWKQFCTMIESLPYSQLIIRRPPEGSLEVV